MYEVLIVEDDPMVAMINKQYVNQNPHFHTAAVCSDGAAALRYLTENTVHLCILDMYMPRMNGLDLLKKLRELQKPVSVIMVTAANDAASIEEVLRYGAVDYLVKPFDFSELMAVVRVMTRKYTGNRSNVYTLADLTIDTASKSVKRAGKSIDLTAKEFSLLEYMMRNRGVVLSREMIEDNLWNYDYEGGTNIVDVYVGYLRKKMDTGFDKKLIHTVWGSGWVLKE